MLFIVHKIMNLTQTHETISHKTRPVRKQFFTLLKSLVPFRNRVGQKLPQLKQHSQVLLWWFQMQSVITCELNSTVNFNQSKIWNHANVSFRRGGSMDLIGVGFYKYNQDCIGLDEALDAEIHGCLREISHVWLTLHHPRARMDTIHIGDDDGRFRSSKRKKE